MCKLKWEQRALFSQCLGFLRYTSLIDAHNIKTKQALNNRDDNRMLSLVTLLGGVLTYILEGVPHSVGLQFCAKTLYLNQDIITLIDCYDPPNSKDTRDNITQLLDRIRQITIKYWAILMPTIRCGVPDRDVRGSHIKKLCSDKVLVILNDGRPTMAATPYANGLSLATPALGAVAEWRALDNSCGSVHLPVIPSVHTE